MEFRARAAATLRVVVGDEKKVCMYPYMHIWHRGAGGLIICVYIGPRRGLADCPEFVSICRELCVYIGIPRNAIQCTGPFAIIIVFVIIIIHVAGWLTRPGATPCGPPRDRGGRGPPFRPRRRHGPRVPPGRGAGDASLVQGLPRRVALGEASL